ncbi:MAG: hypothetical protein EBT83_06720 [Betaproteobacteria bacterium]|nr:hypothetical protein [Betaproteobacteria bacterium]
MQQQLQMTQILSHLLQLLIHQQLLVHAQLHTRQLFQLFQQCLATTARHLLQQQLELLLLQCHQLVSQIQLVEFHL